MCTLYTHINTYALNNASMCILYTNITLMHINNANTYIHNSCIHAHIHIDKFTYTNICPYPPTWHNYAYA